MDNKAQAKELLSRMAHEASESACEAVAAAYKKTGYELTESEKGMIAMMGHFTAFFSMSLVGMLVNNKDLFFCLLRSDDE